MERSNPVIKEAIQLILGEWKKPFRVQIIQIGKCLSSTAAVDRTFRNILIKGVSVNGRVSSRTKIAQQKHQAIPVASVLKH